VLEYWIVDPEIDVVRIYHRNGDRFDRPIELSRGAGDVVTSPILPGFQFALDAIFRDD
jgi:Uma2 family endonuclease